MSSRASISHSVSYSNIWSVIHVFIGYVIFTAQSLTSLHILQRENEQVPASHTVSNMEGKRITLRSWQLSNAYTHYQNGLTEKKWYLLQRINIGNDYFFSRIVSPFW